MRLDADVPVKTEPPQGQVSVQINRPVTEIDPTKNLVSGFTNIYCCLFNRVLLLKLSKGKQYFDL